MAAVCWGTHHELQPLLEICLILDSVSSEYIKPSVALLSEAVHCFHQRTAWNRREKLLCRYLFSEKIGPSIVRLHVRQFHSLGKC